MIYYIVKRKSRQNEEILWNEQSYLKKWLIQKGQVLKEEFYWKEESWKERV